MTNSLPILFAAKFDEIVGILVTAAFFVIWLINQISDAKKKQVPQGAKPQPAAPPPPAQPAQAKAVPGAPAPDPLRSQIDEFLRRAAQQKLPQQAAPRPPQRPPGSDEIVVLIDEPNTRPPAKKSLTDTMRSKDEAAAARREKPAKPPRRVKSPPPKPAPRQPHESVAQHVAHQVSAATQEFREEVADLGQRVKRADEQFDEQLHQKFDHTLGSLADRAAVGTGGKQQLDKATTPAAQIAAMLTSPEGVRQAVLLNEILRRPTDRW